jgi:DNA (cytosine-5)-methyltransferase 1
MFSGVLTAELALPEIDWKWAAEIDPFCCDLIRYRSPIPNLGDVTAEDFCERAQAHGPVDTVFFGSPCQGFSVAGKRGGLGDPRSNLALVALRILDRLRPAWFLFENVPGLLSCWSGDEEEGIETSDFSAFLSEVERIGYLGAWSILDAQWFGVPQRRRRVFFVGHLGDWRGPAAVLSEFFRLSGHPPPRREARERITYRIAPSLTGSGRGAQRAGESRGQDCVIPVAYGGQNCSGPIEVTTACNAKGGVDRMDFDTETFIAHTLRADGFDASEDDGTGRGVPIIPVCFNGRQDALVEYGDMTGPLDQDGWTHTTVAFDTTQVTSGKNYSHPKDGDPCHPLASTAHAPAIAFTERTRSEGRNLETSEDVAYAVTNPGSGGRTHSRQLLDPQMAVRRLTPLETERLQGLPDLWTYIPLRRVKRDRLQSPKKDRYMEIDGEVWLMAADGPRYRAVGNGMALPVIRYLGLRMIEADRLLKEAEDKEAIDDRDNCLDADRVGAGDSSAGAAEAYAPGTREASGETVVGPAMS